MNKTSFGSRPDGFAHVNQDDQEGDVSGPKRGTLRRALGKDAFVKLDRKYQ